MIFRTVGKKYSDDSPALVYIQFIINQKPTDQCSMSFVVCNMGNVIKESLQVATTLFYNRHPEYFAGKASIISVSSSIAYSSPYLTSLFLFAFMCKKYNMWNFDKCVIYGDIDINGNSSNESFSITEPFKLKYPDYKHLYNMSYNDIEKYLAATKIQRIYLSTNFESNNFVNDDFNSNEDENLMVYI